MPRRNPWRRNKPVNFIQKTTEKPRQNNKNSSDRDLISRQNKDHTEKQSQQDQENEGDGIATGSRNISVNHEITETEEGNTKETNTLTYAIALVPALIALVKILVISSGSEETFRVLTRTLNIPAIAMASITPLLPLIIGMLFAVVIVRRCFNLSGKVTFDQAGWIFVAIFCWGGAVIYLPAIYMATMFFYACIEFSGGQVWLKPGQRFNILSSYFLPVYLFIMLTATSLHYMWLPAEVIERKDGTTIEGYVLEAGDHDLSLLHSIVPLEERGRVTILRQDDVVGRTLCKEQQEYARFPDLPYIATMSDVFLNKNRASVAECKDVRDSIEKRNKFQGK